MTTTIKFIVNDQIKGYGSDVQIQKNAPATFILQ